MTTKQEIIDYVNENVTYDMYDCRVIRDTITDMIEDLKLTVGKLEWQNNWEDDIFIAEVSEICKYKITNYKGQWTVNYDDSIMYYELKKAQEACQKHYEETN